MKKQQMVRIGSLALKPANPARGRHWRPQACVVHDEALPPCEKTDEELDAIFSKIDPEYDATGDDVRHSRRGWAARMRLAGTHEDLVTSGRSAFTIKRGKKKGTWSIQTVKVAVESGSIVDAMQQCVSNLRRQHLYLIQGLDTRSLPERDKREIANAINYTQHMLEGCNIHLQIAQSAYNCLMSTLEAVGMQAALPLPEDEERE